MKISELIENLSYFRELYGADLRIVIEEQTQKQMLKTHIVSDVETVFGFDSGEANFVRSPAKDDVEIRVVVLREKMRNEVHE